LAATGHLRIIDKVDFWPNGPRPYRSLLICPQNAPDLGHVATRVLHVGQNVVRHDHVEAFVLERQNLVFDQRKRVALAHHAFVHNVHAVHRPTSLSELSGDDARAHTHVQELGRL
jgi:hypothetical protein